MTNVYDQNALLIQHDWNEIDNGKNFFIGCRRYNQSSEYIILTKANGEIVTGIKDAVVTKLSERKIDVKYAGFANQVFIAPSVSLNKIHEYPITCIDLSQDGNLIVSGDANGNLKIWNARNGVIQHVLVGHLMDINRCCFLPLAKFVISCGLDMTIRVWSVSDGECAMILKGHSRDVTDFALIENSKRLISSSKDQKCILFDIELEQCVQKWEFDSEVYSVTANSKLFICGLSTGDVVLTSLTDGNMLYLLKIGKQICTFLTISDSIVYCGSDKGEIHCFNIENMHSVSTLRTVNGRVTKLKNSSFGLIASFADGVLNIFDSPFENANSSVEFTGVNVDSINSFAFSEADGFLFSVCRDKLMHMFGKICGENGKSLSAVLLCKINNDALFNIVHTSTRSRSGAPRFKPRVVHVRKLKTPTMFALDYFDFYYGPLFGKKWPSIRLGLLSQNKFVAVLNRFSQSYEVNEQILNQLGTLNMIDYITKGTETPSQRVERKRLAAIEKSNVLTQEINAVNLSRSSDKVSNSEDEVILRTDSSAISHFREEKQTYSFHELKPSKSTEDTTSLEKRQIIKDSEFQVTGLEGINQDNLPVLDDFIYYPRDLRLCVFSRGSLSDFPAPIKDSYGISSWWLLDGGSVLPVLALDLNPNDAVLDMCAAPGGKSMLIIQTKKFTRLVCNDSKLPRLGQLRRALAMYVPDTCEEASKVIIKRKDASSVECWDELDNYDKVLVDAPCTTDRLSATQDENNLFSVPNVSQRLDLPLLQTRLLVNALRSVKVGGSVVYSTCSLAPTQNECVVENAAVLAQQYYGIRCVEQSLKHMEKHLQTSGLYRFSNICKRGILVLPTILSNFGPMYVCKIKRLK